MKFNKRNTAPLAERMEKHSTLVPFCGCKLWFGASVPFGYGMTSVNGKNVYAHRAAWTLEHGEIPEGMFVLHSCDMPACINVDHLFLGTLLDNTKDMISKNRQGFSKNKISGPDHHFYGVSRSGESAPYTKINRIQVNEIRAIYANGKLKQSEIAALFGIKQPHISRIIRGEVWA